MKKYFRKAIMPAALAMLTIGTTGCLEEAFPEDNTISSGQISGESDKAALVAAMPAYFMAGGDEAFDIGFAGFQIFMDAMTADYPTNNESWDYFRYFNTQISIGNIGVSQNFWVRYYYLLQKANSVISFCDDDPNGEDAYYMGAGLCFRAFCFLDLARMFEYKHTNVANLDDIADSRNLWGLTVPIITDKTTEAESRVTPRAPFYEMYRFINDDLLKAESFLHNSHSAPSKTMPCLGVAYGLHARLWLEMGSRFDLYPADLDQQIDKEVELEQYAKLGITSANDCYANAAKYARLAINEGFTPLTESMWYSTSSGFNSPNTSWLWCMTVSPNDAIATNDWKTIPSFKSPEAAYGMASITGDYKAWRMLDARLWTEVDANDWRRNTWVDPDFVAMEDGTEKRSFFNENYASKTMLDYESFCQAGALAGFKFRPASGNTTTPTIANLVSLPLMRVEEMYLIEAEALAHSQSPEAGREAIVNFMNTYRMKDGTTFECNATQLEDVINVIWTQKRIELWGEGQVYWDYKRRELAIERGYTGTNHPTAYRYNSYPNAVAPWTNLYIPDRVESVNHTIVLNPSPNQAIPTLWSE